MRAAVERHAENPIVVKQRLRMIAGFDQPKRRPRPDLRAAAIPRTRPTIARRFTRGRTPEAGAEARPRARINCADRARFPIYSAPTFCPTGVRGFRSARYCIFVHRNLNPKRTPVP